MITAADLEAIVLRIVGGERIAAIAADRNCTPQAIYARLKLANISLEQLRPPKSPDLRPWPPDLRPAWSRPSKQLLALVREARRELQAALARPAA
jgi:hypothetical protein